ncbi:RidA family protein [Streptomyces sp. BV129]|uniref:RidA family protein n=1 Tax=Streptomyces sp. BV129 TaxID=2849671 RepID=UPI0035AC138F
MVKLTVFLTDLDDLAAFRRVRDELQDPERPPACSLVRVAGLVRPEFRVEIEAWALVADQGLSSGSGRLGPTTPSARPRQGPEDRP